jgi:hypothetical protein
MSLVNNTTTTANFESWFIVVSISTITSLVLAILLAIIFLIIVIFNKTCQTMSIMLISNSCMAEIVYGCNMLGIAVSTFENDRKQRVFQDALCTFRDYFGYVGTALLLYSFTLQAIYRYIIIVYPTRISWQSVRVQCMLICFFWIFSITSLLPWLITGVSTYNVENQACILPFRLSVPIIYNVLLVYIIPVFIIILIYFKLVRYVRQISNRATSSAQTMFQARRELAMVQRLVTIISFLLTLGLPYTIFVIMSFITNPPKYYYRIAILFVDLSQPFIIAALFKYSQPVMDVLLKFKRIFSNVVYPIAK